MAVEMRVEFEGGKTQRLTQASNRGGEGSRRTDKIFHEGR